MKVIYHFCFCIFLLPGNAVSAQPQESSDSISHYLEMFSGVYHKVMHTYPGHVEPEQFLYTGIDHMLQSIDPFTEFFTESEVKEFSMNMSGKFGGTGMMLGTTDQGVFIQEVFPGMPAAKAGLRAADIIQQIDETSINGKSVDEVRNLLMGEPGTPVSVIVTHPADAQPDSFHFEREMIRISAVPYYGMLNNDIGYIRLSRESAECTNAVKAALQELHGKQVVKGLVFDLRGNEGGYFREAVMIANLFIEKGNLLVSSRSKEKDTSYYAIALAEYPALPLVLLTDNATVSSGEILAGAIQDNDRAVVIGQRTFGKGLVQQLFDMPGGTQLKLTTAHYYTPSGRCIQAFEYDNGNTLQVADSLRTVFKTKNGRSVYSNGGITPDIETEYKEPPAILRHLLQDYVIFDFSTTYHLRHPSIAPASAFHLSEQDYRAFIEFVKDRKYTYSTETETELLSVKERAIKEGYWQDIQEEYSQVEQALRQQKETELYDHQSSIINALEVEIAYRYYGQDGRFEVQLRDDHEVQRAIEILQDPIGYRRLLHAE